MPTGGVAHSSFTTDTKENPPKTRDSGLTSHKPPHKRKLVSEQVKVAKFKSLGPRVVCIVYEVF